MLRKTQLVDGRLQTAEEGPVWLVAGPDEGERRQLVDVLKVDEHTLNSALDPDELRSRLGFGTNSLALTFELKTGAKHQIEFGGLSPENYPYAAVKLDGVLRVARRLLRDEALTTVVVGKPVGINQEP